MEMDSELSSVTTYPVPEEPNIVAEGPMVDEVYTKVPLAQCREETGKAPTSLRWIDTNKGDDQSPEHRSRLVVRELKRKITTLSASELFASTPPLEML
eukprot:3358431-Heterocapsa_arctica.AAC.1